MHFESCPTGFEKRIESGCSIIEWRRPVGGVSYFLAFCLAGMTFACIFAFISYFQHGKLDDGTEMPFWFPLAFVFGWIFLATLTARLTFCVKTFAFHADHLSVETKVLFANWRQVIQNAAIQSIDVVKDGGENDDSFHTWGVTVESAKDGFYFFKSTKQYALLWRAGLEQSEWLHDRVLEWHEKQEREFGETQPG